MGGQASLRLRRGLRREASRLVSRIRLRIDVSSCKQSLPQAEFEAFLQSACCEPVTTKSSTGPPCVSESECNKIMLSRAIHADLVVVTIQCTTDIMTRRTGAVWRAV